jgi:cytochrome P450 family 142 subfamily A polypeptide 1
MTIGAHHPAIDLLDGRFYAQGSHELYTWMRQHEPVYFDERNGVWGAASYDAVLAASKDTATFSSSGGIRPDSGPLPMMIDMDDPAHWQRRKLVNRGFTPKRVRDTEPKIRELCDTLIDRVCEQGACDFVRDLAAPLPMIVIGDMLGIPVEDRDELLRWSDDMLSSLSGRPEHMEAAAVAFGEYQTYAQHAIAQRRVEPTHDLYSVLAHAEVDGDRLNDDELVFESLLLLVGGDETTRHVITGGVEALAAHPAERRKLLDDPQLLSTGVEEMLRWVTPVKNMHRTVTRDVELEGRALPAGESVLLLYESANFDDTHFADPERFDVERVPNDHLAVGFGAHFCLGASLARLEIATMIGRVLQRLPDLEIEGEPERFMTTIAAMPVRFTPTAPGRAA